MYHERVRLYRKVLIEAALARAGGNRTRAARALGLQRTYLLRLVRELGCDVAPGRIGSVRR